MNQIKLIQKLQMKKDIVIPQPTTTARVSIASVKIGEILKENNSPTAETERKIDY